MHANRTPAPSRRPASSSRRWLVSIAAIMAITWTMVGCNDYPLQPLVALPYLEITDSIVRSKTQAVDILFVVDNSGSMRQEQEKLARNFKTFIEELAKQDIGNYQIGIVSTDMFDPFHKGKLLAKDGQPKIIKRSELPGPKVIEAFQANINLGTRGIAYEKPLDAMRAALSPKMLADANKGFLRPGALLAVIFVGDEDDCSHNGTIDEDNDPGVCNLPNSVILKGEDGKPILGKDQQPLRGKLEQLTPVSEYIKFLKGLGRTVVVTGLIGNPHVYRDNQSRTPIDPPSGGCQQDNQCQWEGKSYFCGHSSPTTRRCGGCTTGIDPKTGEKDADAAPGYRLYELIKAFGGTDAWFPICGDDEGFREALFRHAGLLINILKNIPLTREPIDLKTLSVRVVNPETGQSIPMPKASSNGKACQQDATCGDGFVCGPDQTCYGDGWVYDKVGGQPKLLLSGNAKDLAAPGTTLEVTYAAKTK